MEDKLNGKRINRYLSDSGYCSRREADRLIEAGRVSIDGRRAVLGDRVPEGATVKADEKTLSGRGPKLYIALHKPEGIVCTADPREPMNVVSYIGLPERVFPVGRLDKDSAGLLLLTSDGEIVNQILRAAGGHEKEYIVAVDKPLSEEFLKEMASGVPILDTVTLPCRIEPLTQNSFRIILTQGLNRQIRRMCEQLGYRVRSLRRVRVMNITLDGLAPGQWRMLTEEEIRALLAMLKD